MSTAYPAGVDSYTTHVTSETILPSHVNNLQDAVVAVETALGPVPALRFADYTIARSGANTIAVNGSTGAVDYTGTNAAAVLQSVITGLGAGGGTVTFKAGTYAWGSVPAARPNMTGWLKLIAEPGTTITLSTAGPRFLDLGKLVAGDTFRYLHLEGFTIDAAALSAYNVSQHIVLGTWAGGLGTDSGLNVNMDHITIRRIRTLNVRMDLTYWHLNIWLLVYVDTNATQRTITNIVIEQCEFNGGIYGIAVAAQGTGGLTADPNVRMNDITIRDIYHDTGTVPTSGGTSAHVQLGSGAAGGTCWVERVHGKNSWDVGIEIDNFETAHITDIVLENYYGFGIDCTNFTTSLIDLKAQVFHVTNITGYQTTAGSWDSGANALIGVPSNSSPSGVAQTFGRLIARNLRLFRKGASLDGAAITGDLFTMTMSAIDVLIDGAEYHATGLTHTTGTPSTNVVYTNPTSRTRLTLRNIDIRMDGTFGVASPTAATNALWLSGYLDLLVDNVAIDVNFTNVAGFSEQLIILGQAVPSTISGALRNIRCAVNDVNGRGIFVYDTSRLTIPSQILFENFDFTGMASGSAEILYGDTANKVKTVARNTKWRVHPMAPYTITAPTSATGTQFTEGFDAVLQITGGTVTVVAVSRNNSTFYQVAAGTNVAVPIQHGDYYRITYTVAPTITVMAAR